MNNSMLIVCRRRRTANRGAEDDRSHGLDAARIHAGAIRRVARLAEKRRNDPVGTAALLRLPDRGGEGIFERQLVRGIPGKPVEETKVSRDAGHKGIGWDRQSAIGAKRTGIAAAKQIDHKSGVLSGTSCRVAGSGCCAEIAVPAVTNDMLPPHFVRVAEPYIWVVSERLCRARIRRSLSGRLRSATHNRTTRPQIVEPAKLGLAHSSSPGCVVVPI
jgi:hypothetical protein